MNGILVISKDIGYTSRDVVNSISKIFNTKKVGHTGTLDPLASGVLIVCVGKALKICELLNNCDKEYTAGVTLGIATDTLDNDGKVIKECDVHVCDDTIKSVVNSFLGKYEQVVPMYSAVKVNGRKLYQYARSGIDIVPPSKEVEIKKIQNIDKIIHDNGHIYFKLKCTVSKGTYIRSLVRDIGEKLNVPAVMNSLVRDRVGNFSLADSFSLEDVKCGNFKFVDIMDAFPDIPRMAVNKDTEKKVKNGVVFTKLFNMDLCFLTDTDGNLLALYKNVNNECRPYKMFI